jgi:hypothetical protein
VKGRSYLASIEELRREMEEQATGRGKSPVPACVACRHWRVDRAKRGLYGDCAWTGLQMGYDRHCAKWEPVLKERPERVA